MLCSTWCQNRRTRLRVFHPAERQDGRVTTPYADSEPRFDSGVPRGDHHGHTHRLELTDATLREWDATVLAVDPERGIVLDRSAFYPGGGDGSRCPRRRAPHRFDAHALRPARLDRRRLPRLRGPGDRRQHGAALG